MNTFLLGHAIKAKMRVETKLHVLLSSTLDEDEWSDSLSGPFTSGERNSATSIYWKAKWSPSVTVKVKCTLVQALRLCTGRMAHRRSRGIALPFLDHGTRRGWVVSVTSRPLFTPGKDPVPIVQEAGWTPGPIWTGAENLATGIRSLDRLAHSQSLYQLR
jgi:hypothetical protein